MRAHKTSSLVKQLAKLASSLLAAFILFMFIGDVLEAINRPAPKAGEITRVKVGQNYTLIDSVKDGKWVVSDPAIATIDSLSLRLTGIKPGKVRVTYHYHNGATGYAFDIVPSTMHDAIMLTLLGLIWLGLVLTWWRERAGAWLTISALVITLLALHVMNQLPFARITGFLAATLPAIALLVCNAVERRVRKDQEKSGAHQ